MHICHNLATTVLGGQISVRSLPGQGSRFELTMPRNAPARVKSAAAPT
jgi:signal transduction histidine kinase